MQDEIREEDMYYITMLWHFLLGNLEQGWWEHKIWSLRNLEHNPKLVTLGEPTQFTSFSLFLTSYASSKLVFMLSGWISPQYCQGHFPNARIWCKYLVYTSQITIW